MNEPSMVILSNGACRAYDNLDRRIACTPQSEWTAEMIARVVSDQQASAQAWPPKPKEGK